jgi:L-fuculose-phosphate aldolase
MATTEKAVRESIIARGATVVAAGLGGALVGDISARFKDSLLITPSGANYGDLRPAMIARMPLYPVPERMTRIGIPKSA